MFTAPKQISGKAKFEMANLRLFFNLTKQMGHVLSNFDEKVKLSNKYNIHGIPEKSTANFNIRIKGSTGKHLRFPNY